MVGVVDFGVVFGVVGLAEVLVAGGAAVLLSSLDRKKPGATKPVIPTAASRTTTAPMAIHSPVLPCFGGAGGPPKPWP